MCPENPDHCPLGRGVVRKVRIFFVEEKVGGSKPLRGKINFSQIENQAKDQFSKYKVGKKSPCTFFCRVIMSGVVWRELVKTRPHWCILGTSTGLFGSLLLDWDPHRSAKIGLAVGFVATAVGLRSRILFSRWCNDIARRIGDEVVRRLREHNSRVVLYSGRVAAAPSVCWATPSLAANGIFNRRDWHVWLKKNHPDAANRKNTSAPVAQVIAEGRKLGW